MSGEGRIIIFKVGDYLAHPGHGGCTVRELSHRTCEGKNILYFVLVPACEPQTTILLPVERIDQSGVRALITATEAEQIMDFMCETEAAWDCDHRNRKQSYEAVIKGPDLFALAKMIKELLVQETKTMLGSFEKGILPRAQKRLFSEIALAKGLCFDETVRLASRAIQA
ncbi:MAG: hypothetical protein LBV27_05785 [Oscillospiraceae bacterium]|nr:hypothetical protein [Oscillospiraceae bacterium]